MNSAGEGNWGNPWGVSLEPTNTLPIPYQTGRLKPCPFCGGPAKRYATDGHNTEWYVMCKDCGCSTKARHRGQDIEEWNRRVSE